ncbi:MULTISPECIES: signal peptidase I [unclassified Ruminococcus]|uniref:signal peptidase I n=1 Tax=unclassified Ruminococcus TaxID=2608920 RepID=UPI00210AA0A8|nr:signal peptidase I [Ruminococcus sp. zg-924]MCQ4113965.1 signal peptidase I [Ruminococcus sp. zg-921]
MKTKKSIFSKITNVLLSLVIIILALVIAVTVFIRVTGNTPSFFGYSIFRVSSGSMEPELMVGDVILTHEVTDYNSLEVGDVITFRGSIGEYENQLITHKIVKAPYQENGITYVVTKGVANLIEDEPVSVDKIEGELVCKIPFLDAIYGFFLTPWGLLLSIAVILLLFAGEFWNIFKLSRNPENDLPKVDAEMLDKAIEKYKSDNNSDGNSDDSITIDALDNPDND